MKSQIKRWNKDAAVLIPREFLVEAKLISIQLLMFLLSTERL